MDFVLVFDKKYGFLCQKPAKSVFFSTFRWFLTWNWAIVLVAVVKYDGIPASQKGNKCDMNKRRPRCDGPTHAQTVGLSKHGSRIIHSHIANADIQVFRRINKLFNLYPF